MSDLVDKKLEELATLNCNCSDHAAIKALALALLRARQFLSAIQGAPNVPTLAAAEELAVAALADTELEEALP